MTQHHTGELLRTPVAIVGGGPVGLMLALFLDRHGVPCTVFNAGESVRAHPKGSTHNARTMEHYRRLGFAHRVREVGLPHDHPTDVAYFTRFNGWELARLPMPSEAAKLAAARQADELDQVPEPVHRANQMYVEPILLEEAERRPGITLRYGWRLETLAEDDCGVRLVVEHAASGIRETWHADYLAGCDGGRSTVRGTLGIRYEGEAALRQAFFGGAMVSTYLRAPTLYRDFLGHRRAWQYWIVNTQVRTALVPLNGKDEFLLWTRDTQPEAQVDDAAVTAVLRQCTGTDVPVQVLAHAKWTAGVALVAERFGNGRRIWLAGDAVHLFTPTGGFGMNTGVDDAANLAWKLAAMVQGWGGAKLLASYESERRPVARRNTTAARALARNVGQVPVPPELEDSGQAGERARTATGAFLSSFGEEYASIGVQLGARYDDSPIVLRDVPPPEDDLANYRPSGVPGGRAPHFWLDAGREIGSSLYDRLGVGFTLLYLGTRQPQTAALEQAARERGAPLALLSVPHAGARMLYGSDYVLIRPDQHIAWRGDALPVDARALLARVCGDV